jgi:hypothetical protein
MNARRREHLAGLGLPIAGRDVLEVGAGIGDLTSFFLDRGCSVASIEPRPENRACFASQYDESWSWPTERLRILPGDAWRLAAHGTVSRRIRCCSATVCFTTSTDRSTHYGKWRRVAQTCSCWKLASPTPVMGGAAYPPDAGFTPGSQNRYLSQSN